MSSLLAEFQECLRGAKRIVALVGAGLSASSGLPTYLGLQGLWKNYNMIDLATPDAFYIDPGLVWQFYLWRRHQALMAAPNAGHKALAQLSHSTSQKLVTITQNVDGLLARAGHKPRNLYEIHGLLFELRCTSFSCTFVERGNEKDPLTPALAPDATPEAATPATWRSEGHSNGSESTSNGGSECSSDSPQFLPARELTPDQLPLCPVCQSLLRPGVVWFGESLPMRVLDGIDLFLEAGPVDLILVIGTSGTVYPANSYVDLVRLRGGKVAIFNTDIDQAVVDGEVSGTWGFRGDAAHWLPIALEPVSGECQVG